MKSILLSLTTLFLVSSFTFFEKGKDEVTPGKILYDFQDMKQRRSWFPLNDNVMGGVSTGTFHFTKENTLKFSGTVSLQNKGGFASIRSKTESLNLKEASKFKLRVKGDGRSYYFNISSSNFVADPGFQAAFSTKKGQWQEVDLALEEFSPAFGSRSSLKDLKMENINIMGLIISDKKAGAFELEVDWIKAV